ncbi:MAG: thiol:disulfide interchange protein DsbA/DsbL [Pseudomonadales bacterium]|nr:thiol:disulfide interchange protein DsbA/DsbL [Pseudomonadales bacterium]
MSKSIGKYLAALLLLAPIAISVHAQPEKYLPGTHYIVLETPQRTADPEKIEVMEIFWYGCGHCFRFQPLVENWHANMADDIVFVQLPAVWNSLMQVHAQAFYTAEAMGVLPQVHTPLFNALNLEGNRLQNERQIATLFAKYGVNEEEFGKVFNSFSVRTKVNQLERKMRDYQIQSTPNMSVNGKYLISTNEAVRTQQEMLDVVDFLVAKERAAR